MKLRAVTVAGQWSEALARTIDGALRDAAAILNGGLVLADQGIVRSFRWNTARAPVSVAIQGGRPPLGLLVLRARPSSGAASTVSGCAVTWSWDGRACVVSAIDGLASDTDYEVSALVLTEA